MNWGSRTGQGITVQRDPRSPGAPSDAQVRSNRCHDNEQEGIAFFSANGTIEDNECWGCKLQGIAAWRDSTSPGAPSEVQVRGNRCHDNDHAGIVFSSANGTIENNECWNSKEGSGIIVLRDKKSSDAPSEAHVHGNRCHDNEQTGIIFCSSTGSIIDNECWANKKGQGIGVARGEDTPDAPSEVQAYGNRCHDNEQAGIAFLSSNGTIEDNECWGCKTGPGIAVQRGQNSPGAPSDAQVRGNRCHANKQAGIVFQSSNGAIEDNECWGSKTGSGITVQRDQNSPGAPSDAQVRGNRCHDNKEAGIAFFSANGTIENNECWGSKTHQGIAVGRDQKSSGAPSEVQVHGNRCHDNKEAGIIFFSSIGTIKNNECWGSKTNSGIVALRDQNSPNAPSDVQVCGNHCHDNQQIGIAFSSAVGAIEDNVCWENKLGDMPYLVDTPEEIVTNHRTHPSVSPENLRSQQLANKPMSKWLLRAGNIRGAEALADFIFAGGCLDCFNRFWQKPSEQSDAPAAIEPPQVAPRKRDEGVYGVQYERFDDDHTFSLEEPSAARNTIPRIRGILLDQLGAAPLGADNPLSRLFQGFVDAQNLFRQGGRHEDGSLVPPPIRVVALVSPAEQPFGNALSKEVILGNFPALKKTGALAVHLFNLAGTSATANERGESFLLRGLLDGKNLWWERIKALPKALAALIMLGMPATIYLAAYWGYVELPGNTKPFSFDALRFTAEKLLPRNLDAAQNIFGFVVNKTLAQWSMADPWGMLWQLAFALLVSAILLIAFWNHSLPGRLGMRVSETALRHLPMWLDKFLSTLLFFDVLMGVGKLLDEKMSCSEANRRRWIRRQVFGHKWLGLFGKRPDLVIVGITNVEALDEGDKEQLRELIQLCPDNQGLLLLTHMPGLSMLVDTWLDVWWPEKESKVQIDWTYAEAFVLHDLQSQTIKRFADTGSCLKEPDAADRMAHIFGWSDNIHERNVPFQTLINARWGFGDLMSALVIGSNHYASMYISKLEDEDFYLWRDHLIGKIAPYYQVFNEIAHQSSSPLKEILDKDAVLKTQGYINKKGKGKGLFAITTDDGKKQLWYGLQSYRKQLSEAVHSCFRSAEESDLYLRRLLACGELFHLNQAIKLLEKWRISEPKDEIGRRKEKGELQMLPLHLEAALSLLKERKGIDNGKDWATIPILLAHWSRLGVSLMQPVGRLDFSLNATRACVAYLGGVGIYQESGHDFFEGYYYLDDLISQPLEPLGEKPAPSTWDSFLSNIQDTFLGLPGFPPAVAKRILEAKLQQDWYYLPSELGEKLRKSLEYIDKSLFQKMCEMPDTQALMKFIKPLCQRPAVLTANLVVLAVSHIRRTGEDVENALMTVADAAMELRQAAGNENENTDFIATPGKIDSPAQHAAWIILQDPALLRELVQALADARDDRKNMEKLDVECEIEGIALGMHGAADQALSRIARVPLYSR